MDRYYHKWRSVHLDREMELLVFGNKGARVVIFPTRNGRFYEYENCGMIETLREKVEKGWLQLFCVDGIDVESLYGHTRSPRERIVRHIEYQRYITDEVLPFSEDLNPRSFRIAHGSSLGAYHAVNLAFRYPESFDKVVAFSGRYDLTQGVADFQDLFHGYYDEDVYFNNPSHFLTNLTDEKTLNLLRRLELVFVIGVDDPFFENNIKFSRLLWDKQIWHSFTQWSGRAHKWKEWRQMVDIFL